MFYWAIRGILCPLAWMLFRVRVTGAENVPGSGPLVVCANHISWWDPVLVAGVVPRKICFMAKEELFRYPLFGRALLMLGAFPVRRGTSDRRAIVTARGVLERGGVIGVFPEGTRSRTGELGKAHNGAAYLAMRNGAAVLPVGITGPYRIGQPVKVAIGKPLTLGTGVEKPASQEVGRAGALVMEAIAGLIDRGNTVGDQVC